MPGTTDSARRRRAWWCGLLLAVAGVAGAADRPIAIAPERLVLATFRFTQPGYWRRLVDQIGERYRVEASYAWTMRSLGETCVVFRLEPGTDPAPVVAALRADRRVGLATQSHNFRTLGDRRAAAEPAWDDTYAALQVNLSAIGLEQAHRRATGRGVHVAVVDTGADFEHPELAGRLIEKRDFVDLDLGAFATDVHGTAIAGVIAATANNGLGMVGVAPEVDLSVLKGCWPDPPGASTSTCNSYTLARAIDHAIATGARVLNLSLTGPEDPLLTRLLMRADAAGVLVVAATDDEEARLTFPASLPSVLAVRSAEGGHAGDAADALAAPGADILSTRPGGGYDFFTGSSFAAAQVSGVAALLIQREPSLSPSELRHRLSAVRRLDACAALTPVDAATDCARADGPPATPSAALRSAAGATP